MNDQNKRDGIESKGADDQNELQDDKKQLEIKVSQMLTEGEMETADPEITAIDRLPHRYEYRVQAQQDPVREETKQFRKIAKEVDDRYNKY